MEKLLDDLLEYSRIGRRSVDQRLAEIVNGSVLMDNILELLSPPKGFTVTVSRGFADIHVLRMPLQQILMNLVSNAIKHHDKKEGCIKVTVEDDGGMYVFAVEDDGPGIPAQFHEQVFKMFQTLKPRDQVEGSGMGLAMVRKNVEVFGGTIKLESSEGKGSVFRFTWPRNQQFERKIA
jgi:signal transduction histidine kinase